MFMLNTVPAAPRRVVRSYITTLAFAGALLLAAAPLVHAGAIGYGAAATGGGNATPTVVSTSSGFIAAVAGSTPKVVHVSGAISLGSNVTVGSNTTIIGLGTTASLTGRPLNLINGVTNIIIQNVTFNTGGTSYDCIRMEYGTTEVWIDHCTFLGAGDGEVDITGACDYITISWCKFQNASKVTLVGGGDQSTGDIGTFHITYHHNWFGTGCSERMPSVRYGRVHVFNNYYTYGGLGNSAISGINFRVGSEVRIENNYFLDSNWPWQSSQASPLPPGVQQGKSYRAGNETPGCNLKTGVPASTTVFTPSYSYTLNSASSVPAIVQAGAGAGNLYKAVQAESASGQSLFAPFATVADGSASGGSYIRSTTSFTSTPTSSTTGQAAYTVPLNGTVAVWIRMWCPSGAEDSFWLSHPGLNSGAYTNFFNTTGTYGAWVWQKWGNVAAPAANTTLKVVRREANTRFDRVLFTTDLNYTPTGMGP